MTREELESAGYTRYEPSPLNGEFCTDLYQKLVYDDNNGDKKYFINVDVWDFSVYERDPKYRLRFEVNTQLVNKKTGETVDITLLNGWSVEQAEKYLEDMYKLGWFKPYERGNYQYEDVEEDEETQEERTDAE